MAQVSVVGEDFVIEVDPRTELDDVKTLPSRKWDPARKAWVAPYARENFRALEDLGWIPDHLDEPEESIVHVRMHGASFLLETPPSREYINLCKGLPDRRTWKPGKGWVALATHANVRYLLDHFGDATWTEDAEERAREVASVEDRAEELAKRQESATSDLPVGGYRFREDMPPWDHQLRAFALSKDAPAFALLMEMGTGKTRVIVDTATHLKARGDIHSSLVVCPNSIKDTWEEEVQKFAPEWSEHDVRVWNSSAPKGIKREIREWMKAEPGREVRWLVLNVEAMSHKSGREVAQEFLGLAGPCLFVVDESSRIKTPSAKRTRNIVKIGQDAPFRRIMSGTPITKGPLNYFSQFKFLDPDILGYSSYYSFRNRYAVLEEGYAPGGRKFKKVAGYQNLDELQDKVDPFTYRVLRRDCMDLPPKVYEKRYVDLSPDQARLYADMRDKMVAEWEGQTVAATIVLTQYMRLQQITGGFLPPEPDPTMTGAEAATFDDPEPTPIPGPNPKILELVDLAEDAPGKMIVWARFRPELAIIAETLREKFGDQSVVEFHGGVSNEDRTRGRLAFQDPDSPVRFFVGQTETGGLGITLTEAQTVVYYSNSFSLESRLQSEDRAHRGGQKRTVTYVDLIARDTLDPKVLDVLRSDKELADLVVGDDPTLWI